MLLLQGLGWPRLCEHCQKQKVDIVIRPRVQLSMVSSQCLNVDQNGRFPKQDKPLTITIIKAKNDLALVLATRLVRLLVHCEVPLFKAAHLFAMLRLR